MLEMPHEAVGRDAFLAGRGVAGALRTWPRQQAAVAATTNIGLPLRLFTSQVFRNRIVNRSLGQVNGVGFFRYGELPLVLLALLQQRSMNGYEMLGELGRLFSPGYAPSPGSVYPAISALSRSGLIGAEDDNGKTRYQLTPAGEEALAMRQSRLSAIEARCGVYLHDHSEVEAELRRLETAVTAVSSQVEPAALIRILRSTTSRVEALGNSREDR
jgi:DNA-binding PadR family transcriptional regulator